MNRSQLTFDEFKIGYIDNPFGYYPVYSFLSENVNTGQPIKMMMIDMICEWRLADGKIRFLQVPFETEQEYRSIIAYLRESAGLLHADIMNRIQELKEHKKTLFGS